MPAISEKDPLLSLYSSFSNLLTSVNTYADVGTLDCRLLKTKHFYFTATTNDLLVKILGSMDGGSTFPATVEAEFAVDVGTPVSKTVTVFWTHLKVQVKPAVNDTHGTLATAYAAASF